jgi:hypothetical protein
MKEKNEIEKKDLVVTSTRPDLDVNYRPAGSFILRGNVLEPNLNDDAMREKFKEENKKEIK